MTRAVVIMKAGDPEIAGAIEDGMRRARTSSVAGSAGATFPKGEGIARTGGTGEVLEGEVIRTVMDEIERQRRVRQLVRVAVGNTNTPEDYDMMTAAARADYGTRRAEPGPIGKAARWMLGVYGLLCWGIAEAYRKQEIVLGPHPTRLRRATFPTGGRL